MRHQIDATSPRPMSLGSRITNLDPAAVVGDPPSIEQYCAVLTQTLRMSTSKQVVEKAFDCFNKGDIEGLTSLCTEDTRWEVVGNAPWCGVHTGKKAVANDFFGKVATYLELTGLETPHIIEAAVGEWVSCPDMMYKARVLSDSGQDKGIEVPMCIIWQLKDGKVSKYWNYCAIDVIVDALEKAGRI